MVVVTVSSRSETGYEQFCRPLRPFELHRSGTADLLLASPILELRSLHPSLHLWIVWRRQLTYTLHRLCFKLFGAIDLAEARR